MAESRQQVPKSSYIWYLCAKLLWPSDRNKEHLGIAAFNLRKYKQSAAMLKPLFSAQFRLSDYGYYCLAWAVVADKGGQAEAIRICESGLREYPASALLWYGLAYIQWHHPCQERASAESFDKAALAAQGKAVPEWLRRDILVERAAAHFCAGEVDAGIRAAREATRVLPEDARAHKMAAASAELEGEIGLAADEWLAVVRARESTELLKPPPPAYLYQACLALGRAHRQPEAEALLEEHRAQVSEGVWHRCRAALLCESSPVQARQELLKAARLTQNPTDRQAMEVLLSVSLAWIGQRGEAVRELKKITLLRSLPRAYQELYLLQASWSADPASLRTSLTLLLEFLEGEGHWDILGDIKRMLAGHPLRMPCYAFFDWSQDASVNSAPGTQP